jgi:hypothetical protein
MVRCALAKGFLVALFIIARSPRAEAFSCPALPYPTLGGVFNSSQLTANFNLIWKCLLAAMKGGTSVAAFGAKCNGVANDTTPFENAVSVLDKGGGGTLYLPAGTCLMNATISPAHAVMIRGQGHDITVLKPYSIGDVLTISHTNAFNEIRDLTVQGNGFASGKGIVLGAAVFNTKIVNVIARDLPDSGIACIGSPSPNASSGNDVIRSYVLVPLRSSRTINAIKWSSCGDGHLIDNSIGTLTRSVTNWANAIGINVVNGSGGNIISGNFIWQEAIGIELDHTSNLNWIEKNRITQEADQGILSEGAFGLTINDNQFYSNSESANNEYPDIFLNGGGNMSVIGNLFGIANYVSNKPNYNLYVNTGTSNVVINDNLFMGYVTSAVNIAAGLTGIILGIGNQPPLITGLSCSGTPTTSFATTGGVVTHC